MKILKFKFIVAIIAVCGLQAKAQTNLYSVVRTNRITAIAEFREVNGQLYNTRLSQVWQDVDGNIVKVLDNAIVTKTFTTEPIYEAATTSREVHNFMGGITGYRQVPTQVYVGDKKVSGRTIVLVNYPADNNPAEGQKLSFRAMQTGTTNYNGQLRVPFYFQCAHAFLGC